VTGSLNLVVRAADNRPRIVSPLPDRMYYAEPGVATETAITLTLADADTAATSFVNNATTGARITVTSDNPVLILPADMATAIGGSNNARTFTVKHQANVTGVANVTITINDGVNQSTYTFKVTVVPTPNYYWGILAGSAGGSTGSANGTGTAATINNPTGLVRDSQGNLFVSDNSNHVIRKITPQGVVTTFAGTVGSGTFADGSGATARFNALTTAGASIAMGFAREFPQSARPLSRHRAHASMPIPSMKSTESYSLFSATFRRICALRSCRSRSTARTSGAPRWSPSTSTITTSDRSRMDSIPRITNTFTRPTAIKVSAKTPT
jgi:hypothetical protein